MTDSRLTLPALALWLTAALPAAADPRDATAWCAAFWLGWTDVASATSYLPKDPADAALAEAFRTAAVAEGAEAGHLDRWLKRERRSMATMVKAAIRGDGQSRELMEQMARRCEDDARRRGLL